MFWIASADAVLNADGSNAAWAILVLKRPEDCFAMQEGMIALWRGWLPSVIGVIPYVGLNFSVYETLKDMTLKAYGKHAIARITSFLIRFS